MLPPTDIVCNNNSERINDFLPARLTLRQVIKGNFDVVQSTIELLNHVRPETTFD